MNWIVNKIELIKDMLYYIKYWLIITDWWLNVRYIII